MRYFFQNITVRMSFTRAGMLLSGQQLQHMLPVTVSRSGPPRSAVHDQTSFSCLLSLSWLWHMAAGTLGFLAPGIDPSEATPACWVVMSCLVLSTGFALCPLKRELQVAQKLFFGSGLSTSHLAGLLLLEAKQILWLRRKYL